MQQGNNLLENHSKPIFKNKESWKAIEDANFPVPMNLFIPQL